MASSMRRILDFMGRANDARATRIHSDIDEGSRITGTVHIAPELTAAALPGLILFVSATESHTPGPPLAVRKLRVDRWPTSFVLDDADAMIPGRTLSGARRLQLEARVSASGEALPCAGDLVGKLESVDPWTTEPVRISIDHKIGGG
jgi:cytochrome c-type biogenesis protein CcmH